MALRWYKRMTGDHFVIGIVDDEDGGYADADQTLLMYGPDGPDTLVSEDQKIPLDDRHIIGFVKGIAAELLQIDSQFRQDYKLEYERTKSEIRSVTTRALAGNAKPKKVAIL